MGLIKLTDIKVFGNSAEYLWSFDESLSEYFSGEKFIIEYSENIEAVPKAVLAIPFVTNVLPLIWITDSVLEIPELDKDFYESIPEFKKGYINMFPETEWRGKVEVGKIIDCATKESGGSIVFFSGGLDATTSLIRHYEENPELAVIWGADIQYDNQDGWDVMYNNILESANNYKLPLNVIHSSFRVFDNETKLHSDFSQRLKDSYWHGVKHGMAIIGHAAPCAWLKKKKTVYIGSSHTAEDGHVRCASNPIIDNYIRFCGCSVVHDGFELNRQEKANFVVKKSKELRIPVDLHVCWENTSGKNCCNCEKCYRTMVNIWAAGGEPKDYGFNYDYGVFKRIYKLIALKCQYEISQWNKIAADLKYKIQDIRDKKIRKGLKWILTFDFDNPDNNYCRKVYKIKMWILGFKGKISRRLPILRRIVNKLRRMRRGYRKYLEKVKITKKYKAMRRANPNAVFLVLTPEHENIGDHAIAYAEQKFLEQNSIPYYEVSQNALLELRDFNLLNFNGATILVNGGGNLGTLWFDVEELFRDLIKANPKSKIVSMPNTFFYEDSDFGREELAKSVEIYNAHKKLYLFAREEVSFSAMKKIYNNVEAVSDMVLSLYYPGENKIRSGCIVCLRSDLEKTLTDADYTKIMEIAQRLYPSEVLKTDMIAEERIPMSEHEGAVLEKIKQFQSAEVVITDRLHAMIFSAITETPCVVVNSKSPKVKGIYEKLKHLPYIRFAENIDDLERLIEEVLKAADRKYDNSEFLEEYGKIEKIIKGR